MAKMFFFEVTENWQRITDGSKEITNGAFSTFSHTARRIDFFTTDDTPVGDIGPVYFESRGQNFTFPLELGDFLYCKSRDGTRTIGIIPG